MHSLPGADPGFSERGSEHRCISETGGRPPRSYRVFCYYNTKIMLIVRYRAYLVNTRKYLTKYGVGGVVGATPWKKQVVLLYKVLK